jgi:hypothetical protein
MEATRGCAFKTAPESKIVNHFNRILKNVILQNVHVRKTQDGRNVNHGM